MSPPADGAADAPLIELVGVTKTYGKGGAELQALRGVDLTVRAGEFVADHGAERLGQVDRHEHHRLPRRADERHVPVSRHRCRQA